MAAITRAPRSRRGFTFIELLTVIILIGILSSISVLRYIDLTRDGFSTQAAGDLQAVRAAALGYYADRGEWPPNGGPGETPAGLEPYLPGGNIFNRGRWQLAWVNEPADPYPLIGVLLTSNEERMMEKLRQRFGNRLPFINFGPDLMYIISTPLTGF